jgi:hypothetical protein
VVTVLDVKFLELNHLITEVCTLDQHLSISPWVCLSYRAFFPFSGKITARRNYLGPNMFCMHVAISMLWAPPCPHRGKIVDIFLSGFCWLQSGRISFLQMPNYFPEPRRPSGHGFTSRVTTIFPFSSTIKHLFLVHTWAWGQSLTINSVIGFISS